MLILICGPTGGGKSSVRNELIKQNNWEAITWLTTRSKRSGNQGKEDKQHISLDRFQEMQRNGELFCGFYYENNWYGIKQQTIYHAINSPSEYWCLDFPPENLHCFSHVSKNIICIIILPDNEKILEARLNKSQRKHRLNKALQEIEMLKSKYINESITDYVVYNEEGNLEKAVNEIKSLDLKKMLQDKKS